MSEVFSEMVSCDHEELIFVQDKSANLRGIIGIHSTVLGPSLGGLRVWNYGDEQEAIEDVLRLSEAMTYKAAAANLKLGGGKAVIIADPRKDKTPELFRAMGRFVEKLNGRYITAEDVGTSVEDMEYLRETTKYVTGTNSDEGGSGDPSPTTANGVYESIQVCVEELMGRNSLDGIRVSVQGVGHVGYRLCGILHRAGAELVVTDVHAPSIEKAEKEFGARVVSPDEIYDEEVDVFAPCALGAVINDSTIPRLKCKIVSGGANNQLKDVRKHGRALHDMGILYAPDYVANAGGLINIYYRDILGMPCDEEAWSPTGIYENMKRIIEISKSEGVPTFEAADRLAMSRIEEGRLGKTGVN
jgi:leucine dehydrogenase